MNKNLVILEDRNRNSETKLFQFGFKHLNFKALSFLPAISIIPLYW